MIGSLLKESSEDALRRIRLRITETLEADDDELPSDLAVKDISSHVYSAVAESQDDSDLLKGFQRLMMEEQLFLQPGLTLADVADRLESNKNYVSHMVNNAYGMGFPEFLNTLRIDYAEQYLLSHSNAKQNEIAQSCGFYSASSFNNVFKKITGMTPKVWMVRRAQLENKK